MKSPTHPGEILSEDYVKPYDLKIQDLASHIGLSRKVLSEILHCKAPITTRTAFALGRALGTSPQFWLNLQNQFDIAFLASDSSLKKIRPVI